ncbi:hypothetical protein EKE94_13985 [Mesobaculum littorinae]|uniref:Iron ABC transporter permease n=1 Tax=Mesobaculum littorinae TaxID=2486419 RepID=A0A438AG94_9RHOB|nr:iron chelate uptake ABC transporter family permease subunit [Mesobaculum littorinae]RVV97635.1 hypothetical protein EKE94_13985 [Mesobaculum littorinae]
MRRLDGYVLLHLAGLEMRRVDLVAGLTLLGVAVLAVTGSLMVGTTPVHLSDLFGGPLDDTQRYAVLGLRLPRALMGLLAGAAIAVSGAILQSLTRNPIADPGLLGLSQGALLAILFSFVLAPGTPRAWVPSIASAEHALDAIRDWAAD